MKYLIDTDGVIDHFHHIECITRRLEELTPQGLALSIISLAELYEGIYYSRDSTQSEAVLQRFLTPIQAVSSFVWFSGEAVSKAAVGDVGLLPRRIETGQSHPLLE